MFYLYVEKSVVAAPAREGYFYRVYRLIDWTWKFLPVFPDPFYVLIKFMVITGVVQINFIFLSAVPT